MDKMLGPIYEKTTIVKCRIARALTIHQNKLPMKKIAHTSPCCQVGWLGSDWP